MKKRHSDLGGSAKGPGCELLPVTGAAGFVPATGMGCLLLHWQNEGASPLLERKSIRKGLMEVLFVTVG